jgi:UPF0755 protein
MKKIKKLLLIIILLLNLIFASSVIVEIPKGATATSIARILKDNNVIKNESLFKLFVRISGKQQSFLSGRFRIDTSKNNYFSIIEQLQDPINHQLVRITIPEGFNLFQIDELLFREALIDKGQFYQFAQQKANFIHLFKDIPELYNEPELFSLEGFLYPDTYFFDSSTPVEKIARSMINNFQDKVIPVYHEYKAKGTLPKRLGTTLKFYNLISLASIIENEAVVARERKRIAGVFVNRLNERMVLGACPTIHYARALAGLPRTEQLFYVDTRIDSLYNTYVNAGLPPSPISNPGLNSIKAAFNPEKNDLLYFVSRGDGSHEFSRTEQEHESWKRKLLK